MKLKIDNKYSEVGFFSFMKCSFLIQLAVMTALWGALFILGVLIGFTGL